MSGGPLVIVGGSYAAMNVAAAARAAGYAEPIRLIGEEPVAPYHRPPLSKGLLSGKSDAARLPLRAEAFYREQGIDLVLGTRVDAIDRVDRRIVTAGGVRLDYGRLALAVGARPRRLAVPGAALDGVVMLRSLADAEDLKSRLPAATSVVVVGGGFIGLEVAAVVAALGKPVAVVEAQARLLARAASAPLAEFVAAAHRAHGVTLVLNGTVAAIEGESGRVRAVRCADGRSLPADLVVIGIGVVPNVELAVACGLSCPDGIEVDAQARTADPAIVAAGDCTAHPSRHADGLLRLESVQNAVDQGKVAGSTIAGAARPHDAAPWFWSDQYDLKLQMVGLIRAGDQAVVRGDPATGRFSVVHLRAGRVVAVESVNHPADHMAGRKLVAARASLTPEAATDIDVDLRVAASADPRDAAQEPRG